ncbi:uncharacterized protein LOC135156674 [Lytechinus pictus]|uniref:uncharacterized protein LOC135156674 n=1 Tax=Lytechinus pictus TaxID=7653 RepID=UPI0030B9FF66
MKINLQRLCVRCMWLLLNVLAMQDANHLGTQAQTDGIGMCSRSLQENETGKTLNIGDNLILYCVTDTEHSRNQLSWLKDDAVLQGDDRVMIKNHLAPCTFVPGKIQDEHCYSSRLSISNIRSTDEGLYICRGEYRENGTIYLRVAEEPSTTTLTMMTTIPSTIPTTSMTPSLVVPTCSSNMTSEDVFLPSDHIMFMCTTDMFTYSLGSLDWPGNENIQMKNNNTYSTSLVLDVQRALTAHPVCAFSCGDNVQNCEEEGLSCQMPLLSVSPLRQEAEVGGNISFMCEISLKGYTVGWFVSGTTKFDNDQLEFTNYNESRSSVFTIRNLRPDQSGTLFCRARRNGVGLGTSLAARFEVTSAPETSPRTEDPGRSTLITKRPTIHTMPTTPEPQPTTWCLYLPRPDSIPTSASPLSLNLIITIAVCGGVAFIILIAIIIGIVRCRLRDKDPIIAINPVMAFGDMSHDNPVNMDVHFNVYSQHDIYDGDKISSDVLRIDSSKRIPSLIRGRQNGHTRTDRTSSFIPITEDEVDIDEGRSKENDEPGRKLSYYVENDVYVTFDSNA